MPGVRPADTRQSCIDRSRSTSIGWRNRSRGETNADAGYTVNGPVGSKPAQLQAGVKAATSYQGGLAHGLHLLMRKIAGCSHSAGGAA